MRVTKKPSLAETHPELAAQAHGWDPEVVSYASGKYFDWQCEFGHIWNALMGNRAKGSGCPFCANKAVLAGYNDLATTHPELASEADGWDPTKISFGNGKKFRWKCHLGHTWEISPNGRSNRGRGCPICVGQQVLRGYNDLASTHPEIAAQAFGWDPKTRTAGSSRTKVEWSCSFGHIWSAVVADRTLGGNGCAVCSGKQINIGVNDLATTNPELVGEADGWNPQTVTAGSSRKKPWRCNLGHIWEATIGSRASGTGCPVCVGKIVLLGYNDLATTHPELAAEADDWDPTKISFGNGKKHRWKCRLGHTWEISPNARSNMGTGCPICSGNSVLKGFNDLESKYPEIAKQAHNWDPSTVTSMSNLVKEWICDLKHTWKTAPAHRVIGQGCPTCGGKRVLKGFNDLVTVEPELSKEAFNWDPSTATRGSNRHVNWKCGLGHIYVAMIAKRTGEKTGCPYCSNQKILAGFNDLLTTNPELADEADGWNPTTLAAFSNKKVGWKCSQGHKWKSNVGNRSNGKGCPTCAIYGFDPNKPGWLYFIENGDLEMWQIGITNYPDDRLSRHARRNWEVVELRGPMDGHLTQLLETSCLHALEKRGAILGHKAGIDKFDGYSEAWTKASLNVTSIKQIMDWVYEDEARK